MSISIESGKLLSEIVNCLASACPDGWTRVSKYMELKRYPEGDLRNPSMIVCYKGDKKIYDVDEPMDAYFNFVRLFELSENEENAWSAIRLEFDSTGRFKTKFYFDSWPLITAQHEIAEARLEDPSAP